MSFLFQSSFYPLIDAIESFDANKRKITTNEEMKMTNMLHDLLKDLMALHLSVAQTPIGNPVESADLLLAGMQRAQSSAKECIQKIEQARAKKKGSLQFGLFAVLWVYQLKQCHKVAGKIRTFILEHEADMSPPSGKGPFTNADDLIKSLR